MSDLPLSKCSEDLAPQCPVKYRRIVYWNIFFGASPEPQLNARLLSESSYIPDFSELAHIPELSRITCTCPSPQHLSNSFQHWSHSPDFRIARTTQKPLQNVRIEIMQELAKMSELKPCKSSMRTSALRPMQQLTENVSHWSSLKMSALRTMQKLTEMSEETTQNVWTQAMQKLTKMSGSRK
jgi:hypothetical protein